MQEFPNDEHISQKMRQEIANGGKYGDRRQQLVVIGIQMDRSEVETLLDECLLTDAEFEGGPDVWLEYDNPWLLDIIPDAVEEEDEDDEDE